MLQRRVIFSMRPWHSIRCASQSATEDRLVKTTATSRNVENVRKPSSILSRLSDRASGICHDSDAEQKGPNARIEAAAAAHKAPRPRATSFLSARSAQKRDDAAEKWFTGVRELDIKNMDQPSGFKSLPHQRRRSESSKQHEMRPRTDLSVLFAPSTARSATSLRIQTKKELGGDYTSYLPQDGYVEPHQFPIAYARMVLGRNRHIPLNAQAGALNIVEEAVRGKLL